MICMLDWTEAAAASPIPEAGLHLGFLILFSIFCVLSRLMKAILGWGPDGFMFPTGAEISGEIQLFEAFAQLPEAEGDLRDPEDGNYGNCLMNRGRGDLPVAQRRKDCLLR